MWWKASNSHIKSISNTKLELQYLPEEQKMSSATVGGLNTLQATHLKGNVPMLAPSQNKRGKGTIPLIMPKFH